MDSLFALTPAGYERLQAEYKMLSGERMMTLIARIEEAKSGADLVENTELLSALEELKNLNARISRLSYVLNHAELISSVEQDGYVHLGSRVTIQFQDEEAESFYLVGTIEADPDAGFLSDASPLGQAVLNRLSSPEYLEFETPGGIRKFRILHVE